MGVRNVNGQEFSAYASFAASTRLAARAPAPTLRTAEAGTDTAPAARTGPEPSQEQVQQTQALADTTVVRRTGTRMHVDEASKRVVAQIMDENNQVIRQIPPEEMLKIAARFRELRGKLFDERV